jgi:hypothetical protein
VDDVFAWPAVLRPGRNVVEVSDGAGHSDRAILYCESGGAGDGAPVRDVKAATAAVFVDQPVQEQWPFYAEFDGTADNTFDTLPEEVTGAGWIATGRMSKPENRGPLSFTAAAAADVFVIGSEASVLDQALRRAGFEATGRTGRWRNDALALVPFRLFRRAVKAGDRVAVPAVTADFVVLVKRR